MDNRKSLQSTPPSITYFGFLLIKNVSGTTINSCFPVTKKEVTIGRSNSCDIRITLDSVSDVHCIIYYIDDKAYIRDKSRSFTTKVNEKKIGKNNFLLQHTDEIEISGRKLVWEYANLYIEHNESGKKIGVKNVFTTPKVAERQLSTQANTPQDSNNLLNSTKSNMKTPSKTPVRCNKTPIVVSASNISHSSFNELKNCFKRLKTTTICQSEPRPTKSCSMVPGRNIPLIDDTKSTQRKSWTATYNASENSTPTATSILNQLSVERLKRDSTPEFNYSYRYEDDSIQFDSSVPHSVMANDPQTVNSTMCVSLNNLPDSEPDLSTSRRDTYSINDVPLVTKQINTPTPGYSILKGSKTAKASRLRSSSRMVKFARLPNTDSKIKLSKGDISLKHNFTVTDNETNETDCSLDSKKSMQFGVEDLDDDLDGVQPLDSSVTSLLNSPILDNSSVKKSKRGSRGNKVMSLINSIEKQGNKESPKNSIRASDLLSDNKSKQENVSLNGSQNNVGKLEESISSTRRINLENIFESDDSLKDVTCNIENETIMSSKECGQKNDISSVSNDVIDVSCEKDTNKTLEQEYNFASPLNLLCASNSSKASRVDHSTINDSIENESIKVVDSQLESSISTRKFTESVCTELANTHLKSSDTNNSVSVNVTNTTLDHNNSSKTQNNCSAYFDQTIDNKKQVNEPELVQEFGIKVKDSLGAQKDNTKVMEDHSDVPNDVLEYANKTNDTVKNVEVTICEESPSTIVQCMSKMWNTSDHMSTSTQLDNSLLETYVVVDYDDSSKSSEKSKLNNTSKHGKTNESLTNNESVASTNNSNKNYIEIIDSIKEQLDLLHSSLNSTSYSNKETVIVDSPKTSNCESVTSRSVLEQVKTNVSSLAVKVNEIISKHNEPTENIICSVSKTKSVCSNVTIKDTSCVENSNEKDLPIKISDTVSILDENSTKNSSSTLIAPNDLTNAEKENELQRNSQNLILQKVPTIDSNMVNNAVINDSCSTKPTRKILKVIDITNDSSDTEAENNLHIDQMNSNVENTLDTSIGKPQYESTPWTSSKNSKTKFNSTTNVLPNNTSSINSQIKNLTHSPLPEPNVWSQMMKDFNESVKKASVSHNNAIDVRLVTKNLFNNEQPTCPTIQVTPVEELFSGDASIEKLENEAKNNTIQCSLVSSCLPNSATKTSEIKRSSRSSNSLRPTERRTSPRFNKLTTNSIQETEVNTPKSTLSDGSSIKNNTIEKNSNDQSEKTDLVNTSSIISNTNLATSLQVEEKSMAVSKVSSICSTVSNKLTKEMNDLEHNTTSDDRNDSSSSKSLQSVKKTKKVLRTRKKNSNPVTSTRRNLRVKVNSSELIKNKNSVKIISERTLTSNDTDESASLPSLLQTSGKALRSKLNNEKKQIVKDTNKNISTTSKKKNDTTFSKTRLTEKIINSAKTRFTRSSTSLNEICLPKLIKNNKTLSPVKTKAVKVEKTKKTKSLKSNQKAQPKCILPSNPVKTNNDSSEYESEDSMSEPLLVDIPPKTIKGKGKSAAKENSQLVDAPTTRNKDKNKKKDVDINPQLIDPPKKNKEKVKKKDFQSDDSSSLSTKGTKEEKNDDSTTKITSPLRTRSRKRPANTPVSQPNAKGPKRDTSSKAASIASLVTSSPQSQLSSGIKCTRMTSKLTVSQISNISLPETTIKKEKSLTRAKKREISSESSCDSAPSARKMTRRQANVKEAEIKKLTTTTRATSRTKDQNIDEPTNNTRVKFDPNIEEMLVSPKPKKTRSTTTQAVAKAKNESPPPPPRVLRTREKKK